MKPAIALRRQFEALLTPQQLVRYQDLAVRNVASHAVGEMLLPMIGASKEQQAKAAKFYNDFDATLPPFFCDLGRRLFDGP